MAKYKPNPVNFRLGAIIGGHDSSNDIARCIVREMYKCGHLQPNDLLVSLYCM